MLCGQWSIWVKLWAILPLRTIPLVQEVKYDLNTLTLDAIKNQHYCWSFGKQVCRVSRNQCSYLVFIEKPISICVLGSPVGSSEFINWSWMLLSIYHSQCKHLHVWSNACRHVSGLAASPALKQWSLIFCRACWMLLLRNDTKMQVYFFFDTLACHHFVSHAMSDYP